MMEKLRSYLRRISMQSELTFTHAFQGGHMREDAHKRRKKAQSNILVSSNPSQSRVEMMRA